MVCAETGRWLVTILFGRAPWRAFKPFPSGVNKTIPLGFSMRPYIFVTSLKNCTYIVQYTHDAYERCSI